jgi:ferredoxin
VSATITQAKLADLVREWLGQGKSAAAPVRVKQDRVLYTALTEPGQMVLTGFIRPANSIKEFFFPRHEKLYGYRFAGQRIELTDVSATDTERLVIGGRPCDAAALPILDHVFNWDSQDSFYNRRREGTTVVTLACAAFDEHCFCTSVGLGPASERGSDALLLPMTGGGYEVRCLTDKGRRLFAGRTATATETAPVVAGPPPAFVPAAVRQALERGYDDPAWAPLALRCLGCAACAYTCPTCHCFDIVDEGNGAGGYRAKNWDCCQFSMFTLHASGHNPRQNQAQRQRQRIQHKFRIYPEKFDDVLCTGCGNCSRNCPAGLSIGATLAEVGRAAVGTAGVGPGGG